MENNMAKKPTMNEVMRELKLIKQLVIKDLQIAAEDMNYNKKHLPAIRKSLGKSKKIFSEVGDWKANIWDGCSSKNIVSGKAEFNYDCKIFT